MIVIYIIAAISLAFAVACSFIDHIITVPEILGWFVCWFGISIGILVGFVFLTGKKKDQRDEVEEGARPLRSKANELGSGDLASRDAILKWTRKTGGFETILPVKELRGGSGLVLTQGDLVIPSEQRNRHILIIAKTGSGKTTKLILPVLYSDCLCTKRSTIIIDSKPEMWDKLAGLTKQHNPNKNILLFNPLETVRALSWNILAKIDSDTDAKLIANTIIMATDNPNSKSDSPFFRNNALQILTAIMVGLLNDKNEKLSMPRVHRLVHSGKLELCNWLEAHPEAIINARTFVDLARSGSQNADTILSELGMRLGAWDLKAIRSTTFFNELDLESVIERPTLFIVELRESEIEMLRPMANVIVVEILRFLTKRAEQCPGQTLPRPVGMVIDEFASALGRLPDIHVKLNTLRSRNVSIVAAIQSIAQIKAAYGQDADSVLAGFSTKIFMPALDFQDAEWASKESGTMTVRYRTISQGSNRKIIENFATKNTGTQEVVQQRAVLTPDEIGRPANNISTFFLPNTPVFQGHLVPYYEVSGMREAFSAKLKDFKLRKAPLDFNDDMVRSIAVPALDGQTGSQLDSDVNGSANAIGRIQPVKMAISEADLPKTLADMKEKLDWANTNGLARDWWLSFEQLNKNQLKLMVELAMELLKRKTTIVKFFDAYVSSEGNSIDEALRFLDKQQIASATKQATAARSGAAQRAA